MLDINFFDRVINSLNIKENGIYVDCTFGCGNYSISILKKLGPNGKLFAFDCDNESIILSKKIIDYRFTIIHSNFININSYLNKIFLCGKVDGILFDLGVSIIQLKNPLRGFSFIKNGPLDMRMDKNTKISAKDWINSAKEYEINEVIKNFGQEGNSRKIARKIILSRRLKTLSTTLDLSNIIKSVVYKRNKNIHQSTKTFQAIRIYINNELYNLKKVLNYIIDFLSKRGRLVIISFHSLEDKIVKNFIKKNSIINYSLISDIPLTDNQRNILNKIRIKNIEKFKPSYKDIKYNLNIRSAIVRCVEKK